MVHRRNSKVESPLTIFLCSRRRLKESERVEKGLQSSQVTLGSLPVGGLRSREHERIAVCHLPE
jgi:hypothetical protein